jgi:dihydrofolate reductase
MPNVIYSMSVSLDGYIAGPDGSFDWSAPDEELHRFHNERVRALSAQLMGRNLYETMLYWEREDESRDAVSREFAEIWRALPKIVFSTTLESVEGNTRLATGGVADELARLDGDVGLGGAGLAAGCIELVDEVEPFVYPVIVGGGTPFLPPRDHRIDLELLETRTFGSRVTHLRYRRRSAPSPERTG